MGGVWVAESVPEQREVVRWVDGGWRDAAAPSGMRCHTSQLFAGSARRLSPFLLVLQCVCEQHLVAVASYPSSPCVGPRV